MEPTFHIFITPSDPDLLQRLLVSLTGLTERDHISIVFDGTTKIEPVVDGLLAKVHLYEEPVAYQFSGLPLRNKYASKLEPTDFVLCPHESDVYMPDVFTDLRRLCKDSTAVYIGNMKGLDGRMLPTKQLIRMGDIVASMAILPYDLFCAIGWPLDNSFHVFVDIQKLQERRKRAVKFLSVTLITQGTTLLARNLISH
jgi:hypothetical protein